MRKVYTFRSTRHMDNYISSMMNEWNLDRTSIIKLALYLFSIYAYKCIRRRLGLWDMVRELEKMAPPDFPDYATFAEK